MNQVELTKERMKKRFKDRNPEDIRCILTSVFKSKKQEHKYYRASINAMLLHRHDTLYDDIKIKKLEKK